MLHDPFNRTRPPPEIRARDPERARRVRLLAECFEALLDGRLPSVEARTFVAGGGLSWLQEGGDLLGEFWRVKAPAGSHHTPSHVWRELQCSSRGETEAEPIEMIDAMSTEKGHE